MGLDFYFLVGRKVSERRGGSLKEKSENLKDT